MGNGKWEMGNGKREMRKGQDIAERLLRASARILKIVDALPQTLSGKTIAYQLIRCGTAPGASYEEARGAESKADFVHKTAIALKELHETRYWLSLIILAGIDHSDEARSVLDEVEQLAMILGKSISTARIRRDSPSQDRR